MQFTVIEFATRLRSSRVEMVSGDISSEVGGDKEGNKDRWIGNESGLKPSPVGSHGKVVSDENLTHGKDGVSEVGCRERSKFHCEQLSNEPGPLVNPFQPVFLMTPY